MLYRIVSLCIEQKVSLCIEQKVSLCIEQKVSLCIRQNKKRFGNNDIGQADGHPKGEKKPAEG